MKLSFRKVIEFGSVLVNPVASVTFMLIPFYDEEKYLAYIFI